VERDGIRDVTSFGNNGRADPKVAYPNWIIPSALSQQTPNENSGAAAPIQGTCAKDAPFCDRRAPGHAERADLPPKNMPKSFVQSMLQFNPDTDFIPAETGVACPDPLHMTRQEMNIQMDYFSRRLDVNNYNNAMKIFGKIGGAGPRVTTWELYDKAFSFDRVRRYDYVVENMNTLEQFEDNLNTNISNSVAMNRFLAAATQVRAGLNDKYHNGEFTDPAGFDPMAEPAPKSWSD
jgi:hypothetical protein